MSVPAAKYPDQSHIVPLYQEVLRRLRELPGVQACGLTEVAPMDGATQATAIRPPDRNERSRADIPITNYTMVSPSYFAAVGTPVLRGREFLESDTFDATPVAIINSAMAKEIWRDRDPIGRQIAPRSTKYPLAKIVGVVADVKRLSLRESPPPEMYVPYTQKVWPSLLNMSVVLRTTRDPDSLAASVREAVRSVDPDLPISEIRMLRTIVDDSMAQPRFAMLLLGAFGALAMVLAAVGIYGVISYNVTNAPRSLGSVGPLGRSAGRSSGWFWDREDGWQRSALEPEYCWLWERLY